MTSVMSARSWWIVPMFRERSLGPWKIERREAEAKEYLPVPVRSAEMK